MNLKFLKSLRALFLTIVVAFATSVFAQNIESASPAKPSTLLLAISSAVKNNPRTVSTNETLEAVRLANQALRASLGPSGQIYCSASFSKSISSNDGMPFETSSQRSSACGIGGSITLYDGGALRNRIQAAEAGEKALEATYNTSDSKISNTKGGLADETKSTFVMLVQMRERLIFYNKTLKALHTFEKISQDNNLKSAITNTKQALTSFQNAYDQLKTDFLYVVKAEAPDDLEDLESAISSLKIPARVEDAILIANQEGPEVLRRDLNVQMAQFNLNAERASHGPRLTLSSSVDAGAYRFKQNQTSRSETRSASIGLTLSIPLDLGARYRRQSAEKELSSKKSEREAALEDAAHSLRSIYKSISDQQALYNDLKISYNEQELYLNDIVIKIETGQSKNNDILKLLSDVETLERRFERLINMQANILSNFFSVQSITGRLFKDLNL